MFFNERPTRSFPFERHTMFCLLDMTRSWRNFPVCFSVTILELNLRNMEPKSWQIARQRNERHSNHERAFLRGLWERTGEKMPRIDRENVRVPFFGIWPQPDKTAVNSMKLMLLSLLLALHSMHFRVQERKKKEEEKCWGPLSPLGIRRSNHSFQFIVVAKWWGQMDQGSIGHHFLARGFQPSYFLSRLRSRIEECFPFSDERVTFIFREKTRSYLEHFCSPTLDAKRCVINSTTSPRKWPH